MVYCKVFPTFGSSTDVNEMDIFQYGVLLKCVNAQHEKCHKSVNKDILVAVFIGALLCCIALHHTGACYSSGHLVNTFHCLLCIEKHSFFLNRPADLPQIFVNIPHGAVC